GVGDGLGGAVKVCFNPPPPILRALGMKRKLKLGRWFVPFFRLLRSLKWLRGKAIDPFGRAKVRRVERALVGEYQQLVDDAVAALAPETHANAVAIAELPDIIRGYEDIKLRNVE